jgi:hypothetical protein
MAQILHFDPDQVRGRLAEQVNGHWRPKEIPSGESRVKSAVRDALRLWLAGLPEAAEVLAELAVADAGMIEPDLSPYPDAMYGTYIRHTHRGSDYLSGAVAAWVLHDVVARDAVLQALDEWGRARAAELTWTRQRMDKVALDNFMTAAILVHEDARALAMFARESPKPVESLKPSRVRSDRTIAALIAHARVAGRDASPIAEAVTRLFAVQLPTWQRFLDYRTPVIWLLIRDEITGTRRMPSDVIAELRSLLATRNGSGQ